MSELLSLENVSKNYGRTKALDGVSLKVTEGEIVGILGPNGSGKSTLFKIIAGIVRPSSGKVSVAGSFPDYRTRQVISYMSENDYLYRWMSVKELLEWTSAFYDNWDMTRAYALLEFLGIDVDRKVAALSRGMRGRLKIAVALSRSVPIYLLDEPLSGIDAASRSKILDTLIREYRPTSSAMLISTHLVAEAESLFDRVVFLKEGKKVIDEEADSVRERYGTSINGVFIQIYG